MLREVTINRWKTYFYMILEKGSKKMMKKILFGTSNISKLNRIRAVVKGIPVEILGINDLNIDIDIEEDGTSIQENAIKKAKAYFNKSNIPTFSIDCGLFIDKFSEDKQPGLFVRRINGKRATDDEMLDYYKKELAKVGGRSEGKWISSIAFVLDNNKVRTYELIEKKIFTSKESLTREEGWPLSSLAIDPTFNKYVSEITKQEREKLQEESDKKIYDIFKMITDEINNIGTIA